MPADVDWPASVGEYEKARELLEQRCAQPQTEDFTYGEHSWAVNKADAAIRDLKAKYVIDMDDLRGALDAMTVKRDRAAARAEQAEAEVKALRLDWQKRQDEYEMHLDALRKRAKQAEAEVARLKRQLEVAQACRECIVDQTGCCSTPWPAEEAEGCPGAERKEEA